MSERQYVLNMLDNLGTQGATIAMVADTYDVYEFCRMLGSDSEIRSRLEELSQSGGTLVIRPDSGDPIDVLPKMLAILEKEFGTTINDKGYKVLNTVRLLWGDGINQLSIQSILRVVVDFHGYSADNIAFGMGGQLLQIVNRDTNKFAMKASAAARRWHMG